MKKIFLTGASSGIGRATAETLLARGHEVWGTSRDPARLAKTERLHAVRLDLAEQASITPAFAQALAEAGHFDVLINNAGSGHFGAAESLSHDDLRRHFQTLAFGQMELCRLAVASMRERERGLIINVTSLAAELPIPFMAAYNAAKAAMASFTMTLQLELASAHIRLVEIQPGDINTGFNDALARNESSDPRIARTWQLVEKLMQNAPPPSLVAERIAALLDEADPPPRIQVGDFFQAQVAPLLNRLLPQRVRLWGLRKYYRI